MMKFGDKVITCPKCGSNDVEKTDTTGEGLRLIFIGVALLSFFLPFIWLPILVFLIVTYLYNRYKREKKDKIWEIQCKTCHKIFEITDPTLNGQLANNSNENSTITKTDDKNNSEENKLKCSKCEAEIKEGTKFCPECGNAVNNQ